MTHKLNLQKEKLRRDLIANGISLNKIIDFWGKQMTLGKAIGMMDKDDIRDAYKIIAEKDLPHPKFVSHYTDKDLRDVEAGMLSYTSFSPFKKKK